MTLEEAIKHCEEKAEELRKQSDHFVLTTDHKKECLECAKEHEQLAEWLKELKRYREADIPRLQWEKITKGGAE